MCGIFGLLSLDGALDKGRFGVPDDTHVLYHRGPDDHGHYADDRVYLGHRRLSIIDLSTGRQPIGNEDGSVVVVFNGEIYNFQTIRRELEGRGHAFRTVSDTEVIVHAYEEWGERCVERFRGMFAFAVWDSKRRELFLARDRLGIKPLFYSVVGDTLYFASEMKAILRYAEVPRELDEEAFAAYFTLTYAPAPLTFFRHIRKLPPGHTLSCVDGTVRIQQYWDVQFETDTSLNEGAAIEGMLAILREAVRLRMIADVPIGAFLSGGIDSGTVVALMSQQSTEPVRTFCMGFGGEVGGHLDERGYARMVAERYRTEHTEYEVEPTFDGLIDDIVTSFDEPFADASTIPSHHICRLTRARATVALSGLGGDEVFAGYERHLGFRLSASYQRLPRVLRERVIRSLVEWLPERADGHYTVNHLKRFARAASLPAGERYLGFQTMLDQRRRDRLFSEPGRWAGGFEATRQTLVRRYDEAPADDPLSRVLYVDLKTWLPDDVLALTDRMSMLHSLEVRVPFVDHELVEFCARIPSGMKIRHLRKKYLLKKAAKSLLPRAVLNHRKQGFIGPMPRWLQNELKSSVLEILSPEELGRHGLFDPSEVKRILDEHFHRVEMHDKIIWALVMFQRWFVRYLDTPAVGVHEAERAAPDAAQDRN